MKLVIFDLDGTLVVPSMSTNEKFFSGAYEMLTKLSQQENIYLAVATGKSLRGTKAVLSYYKVEGYFSSVQTPDNNISKPNPDMIFSAMSELFEMNKFGCDIVDVIMVGDTTLDMNMARAANVRSIGVSWGYQTPEQLLQAGANVIVKNFDELYLQIGN